MKTKTIIPKATVDGIIKAIGNYNVELFLADGQAVLGANVASAHKNDPAVHTTLDTYAWAADEVGPDGYISVETLLDEIVESLEAEAAENKAILEAEC